VTERTYKCSKCNRSKKLHLFAKRKSAPLGVTSICKACHRKNYGWKRLREVSLNDDEAFITWKAKQLRSNWLARASKTEQRDQVPVISDIADWLRSQIPWTCHYTGVEVTHKTFGVDHKEPVSRGGSYGLSNLIITTQGINGAKGAMSDLEFHSLIALVSKWEDAGVGILKRLRSSSNMFRKY